MGFFDDVWSGVTNAVNDTVQFAGDVVAAPVRFVAETARGENPFDNLVNVAKRGAGLAGEAITAAPFTGAAIKQVAHNDTVDKYTGGVLTRAQDSTTALQNLSGNKEVTQSQWNALAQTGTLAGTIWAGAGAASLFNEYQAAASVGGSVFDSLPSWSTIGGVAGGAGVANSLLHGDTKGAAQNLGVPDFLTDLIPPNSSVPAVQTPRTQMPAFGSTNAQSPVDSIAQATGASTQTVWLALGCVGAIGVAYLATRRK